MVNTFLKLRIKSFHCNKLEKIFYCVEVYWYMFFQLSDWDLGVCLLYEARRKQLPRPPEMNSWIDLRATYRVGDRVFLSCARIQ